MFSFLKMDLFFDLSFFLVITYIIVLNSLASSYGEIVKLLQSNLIKPAFFSLCLIGIFNLTHIPIQTCQIFILCFYWELVWTQLLSMVLTFSPPLCIEEFSFYLPMYASESKDMAAPDPMDSDRKEFFRLFLRGVNQSIYYIN